MFEFWITMLLLFAAATVAALAARLCAVSLVTIVALGALGVAFQKRWPEVMQIVRNFDNLKKLCGSGLLIGINWFLYIWAVNSDHVVETSLGYYINPMVNVAIGFLLLRVVRLQDHAVVANDQADATILLVRQDRRALQGAFKNAAVRRHRVARVLRNNPLIFRKPAVNQFPGTRPGRP